MNVEIYCDGSCINNPGPGGWACLLIDKSTKNKKIIKGGEQSTTNNRMELTAAIKALLALKKPCEVSLYSDSNYVIKGMTQWMAGWQARNFKSSTNKTIENLDLWLKLIDAAKPHKITWHWVKGHSGHKYNELVDYEARSEAIKYLQK